MSLPQYTVPTAADFSIRGEELWEIWEMRNVLEMNRRGLEQIKRDKVVKS